MDDEYELMPQQSFSKLKEDLENLKKKTADEDFSNVKEDLKDAMGKLSNSLNTVIDLFKTATEEMKEEEHEQKVLSKNISPMMEKLDNIIDQNEQIAKGIVAVADMVTKMKEKPKHVTGHRPMRPTHSSHPAHPSYGSTGSKHEVPAKPKPMTPPPMPPPVPPKSEKKKGMFGLFK